jgi:hypothetical protein
MAKKSLRDKTIALIKQKTEEAFTKWVDSHSENGQVSVERSVFDLLDSKIEDLVMAALDIEYDPWARGKHKYRLRSTHSNPLYKILEKQAQDAVASWMKTNWPIGVAGHSDPKISAMATREYKQVYVETLLSALREKAEEQAGLDAETMFPDLLAEARKSVDK